MSPAFAIPRDGYLGLMPHPERYIDATQHPRWTSRRGGGGWRRLIAVPKRRQLLPVIQRFRAPGPAPRPPERPRNPAQPPPARRRSVPRPQGHCTWVPRHKGLPEHTERPGGSIPEPLRWRISVRTALAVSTLQCGGTSCRRSSSPTANNGSIETNISLRIVVVPFCSGEEMPRVAVRKP